MIKTKVVIPQNPEVNVIEKNWLSERDINVSRLSNELEELLKLKIDENNKEIIRNKLLEVETLTDDCYSIGQYSITKSSRVAKKFSKLESEYQRLSLKYEKYNLDVSIKKLDEKIKVSQNQMNELKQENKKIKRDIKDFQGDLKTIITTILGIVLAISIIPTAIVGIEKVSANFILPFIATIMLFGMIMIVFIYSIYQSKVKCSTIIIIFLFSVLTALLWFSVWDINISATPKNIIEQIADT